MGEEIAGGDHVAALRLAVDAEGVGAREDCRAPLRVDQRELPVGRIGRGSGEDRGTLIRARTERHEVEPAWPEPRVGHVLGGDGANSGAEMGAARRDGGRGGGDGDREPAGSGAARRDGECHLSYMLALTTLGQASFSGAFASRDRL